MRPATPDVRRGMRSEGSLAQPDLGDQLIDKERQPRCGEAGGGGEFPLSITAGPGQQPERNGGDGYERNRPRLKGGESAPEPRMVVDELVDRVVDAVVDKSSSRLRLARRYASRRLMRIAATTSATAV